MVTTLWSNPLSFAGVGVVTLAGIIGTSVDGVFAEFTGVWLT